MMKMMKKAKVICGKLSLYSSSKLLMLKKMIYFNKIWKNRNKRSLNRDTKAKNRIIIGGIDPLSHSGSVVIQAKKI